MIINSDNDIKFLYSRGASIFTKIPKGVVVIQSVEQLKELVKEANTKGFSITPRGAGTSRSGQEVGSGVIADMSLHFNKILSYDEKNHVLEVEAGVFKGEVDKFLKSKGRFFPPDPSSGDYCTIGGMFSNNSAGPKAVKWGVMRDWIASFDAILSDGELYSFPKDENHPKFKEIKDIIFRFYEIIEKDYPKTVKNSTGYNLKGVVFNKNQSIFDEKKEKEQTSDSIFDEKKEKEQTSEFIFDEKKQKEQTSDSIFHEKKQKEQTSDSIQINIAPVFIGSEGTLAIITKIGLKTEELPTVKYDKILFFETLQEATNGAIWLKILNPEKLELIDINIIKISGIKSLFFDKILSFNKRYMILASFNDIINFDNSQNPPFNVEKTLFNGSPEEAETLFKLRKTAAGYIQKSRQRDKPHPIVEDISIPHKNLPTFIAEIESYFKSIDVKAIFFGHIGDGNIHINTVFNLFDKNEREKAIKMKNHVHDRVIFYDGLLSAEHGDGKLRSGWIQKRYPTLYPLFVEIKRFFDPHNIFNPENKIVMEKDFDKNSFQELRTPLEYQINKEILKAPVDDIYICNGCGKCKTFCPSFLGSKTEMNSTRGRVTLLQGVLSGDIDRKSKTLESSLSSCLECSLCFSLCPVGIDMKNMVSDIKKGSFFSKIFPKLIKIPIHNKIFNSKLFQNSSKAILGVDKNLIFPKKERLERDKIDKYRFKNYKNLNLDSTITVFYISGVYGESFQKESELFATIKLLELSGFKPILLKESEYRKNIEFFKEFNVVTTDTSLLSSDIIDVFNLFVTKLEFWSSFFVEGRALYNYHIPCHTVRWNITDKIKLVLEAVGYSINILEQHCCGMGGFYGLKHKKEFNAISENYIKSIITDGKNLITPCGACKTGLESKTSLPVSHPVTALYRAVFF